MNKKILDGWKEISKYVGKSPKTLHRWEKEEGFPIIRLKGTKTVFAYPEEIDRWLEEKKKIKKAKQEIKDKVISKHQEPETKTDNGKPKLERTKLVKGIWILAFVFLAAVLFQAYHLSKLEKMKNLKKRKLCYEINGNGAILNIKDQYGKIYKTFKSEIHIFRRFAYDQKSRITIKFCDLNGDGIEDMVFGDIEPGKRKLLRIFISDKDGNLIEKKQLDLSFSYFRKKTNQKFDVFTFTQVEVSDIDSDGKPELIVIQNNTPLYPSCLRILDLNGNEKFRFIHPGRLYVIHIIDLGDKKAIITGGANNYIHKFSLPVVVILKSNWKNFKNKVIDWIQPEKSNFDYVKEMEITYFTFYLDNRNVSSYEEAYLSPRYKDNSKLVVSGIHYTKGTTKIVKICDISYAIQHFICELVFNVKGEIKEKIINPLFISTEHISSPEKYVKKHFKVYYYDGQEWRENFSKITKPFSPFKQVFPIKY